MTLNDLFMSSAVWFNLRQNSLQVDTTSEIFYTQFTVINLELITKTADFKS